MSEPHIALLIMMKNEEKRLHVTLDSVVGVVKTIVCLDTGSVDGSVKILKEFCKKNGITLRLRIGEFVDFSHSRNESIAFAETFPEIDLLLLLDVNDELHGGDMLLKEAPFIVASHVTAFLVHQNWFVGTNITYLNVRLIKPKCGWKYAGVVHEVMTNCNMDRNPVVKLNTSITIAQDRTKDDGKSKKRYIRDKALLLEEVKKNPEDTRSLFYLGQTYACLNEFENALLYYKKRCSVGGDSPGSEELYHSWFLCGSLARDLKMPWEVQMGYYMKALTVIMRVEPLIRMAEHYIEDGKDAVACLYLTTACDLPDPKDAILFVDSSAYGYVRWHLMAKVCLSCGYLDRGRGACGMALHTGIDVEADTNIMRLIENAMGISVESKPEPKSARQWSVADSSSVILAPLRKKTALKGNRRNRRR